MQFGIDPAIVASDAGTELLCGRPLLGDLASQNAISWLNGQYVNTNTHPNNFATLIDAAFKRFHDEMTKATLKKQQLRAIAQLIRFLHVFHMFCDGNGASTAICCSRACLWSMDSDRL